MVTTKTSAKKPAAKKTASPKSSKVRPVKNAARKVLATAVRLAKVEDLTFALAQSAATAFRKENGAEVAQIVDHMSMAAEMSARRTAAAVVPARGTRSKAAVRADVEHETAIAELLPLLAHHGDQAKLVAEEMLRTYGGLDEAKLAIEALKLKIAAMPTSVTAPAKKVKRVKKNAKAAAVMPELVAAPAVVYVPTLESASVNLAVGKVTAEDVLFFKSMRSDQTWKRAYRQARTRLARLCSLPAKPKVLRMGVPDIEKVRRTSAHARNEEHAKRRATLRFERRNAPKKVRLMVPATHQKKSKGMSKGWPEWMTESKGFYAGGIGWVPGNGREGSDSGSTTGAKIKRSNPNPRAESGRRAAGLQTRHDRQQVAQLKEEVGGVVRGETSGEPCLVHGCPLRSRVAFEARGLTGLVAVGKAAVCHIHRKMFNDIGRAKLDLVAKEALVRALIQEGQEPDAQMIAHVVQSVQKPVRAYAVKDGTATAVLFNTAYRAVFAAPISGNGDGNAPVCTFCGNPASVKAWAFKVPANVRPELIELAVDEPVCRDCGAGLYHLGGEKVAKEEQPIDVAGVLEWAAKAKEHFARRNGNDNAPAPEPAHVEHEPAQAAPAAEKYLCPLCQLQTVEKKGDVCQVCTSTPNDGKRMDVRCDDCNGVAHHYKHFVVKHRATGKMIYCDACKPKHIVSRDGYVQRQGRLAPKYDGFEQALDSVETVQDLAPVMA